MNKNCDFSNCYIVGPTGPKGDNGNADTIEIRNAKTVGPEDAAKVIDTYDSGRHILDFEIPMGATGPKQPATFGYKFSDVGTILNLTKQEVETVPLNMVGESRGIDIEEDSFIILTNGIYKIEYYFSGSISMDTALFTEVLKNDEALDGTTISKDLITNTDSDFYGMTVATLNEGDIITLGVRANNDVVLTFAPDINAYLIITKLV